MNESKPMGTIKVRKKKGEGYKPRPKAPPRTTVWHCLASDGTLLARTKGDEPPEGLRFRGREYRLTGFDPESQCADYAHADERSGDTEPSPSAEPTTLVE